MHTCITTYALGEGEQIDGAIKLAVLDEEVCAALQQLGISALVQVLADHLQRGELLALEGQVERLREVSRLWGAVIYTVIE